MEMGKNWLSGNASRERVDMLAVPAVGPTGKYETSGGESVGQEREAASSQEPRNVGHAIARSESMWDLASKANGHEAVMPSSPATSPTIAIAIDIAKIKQVVTDIKDAGSTAASASACGSLTPSYMDLSMTMSNPSQCSVNEVLSDAPRPDDSLLQPTSTATSSSSPADVETLDGPATPRRNRVLKRDDSFLSQAGCTADEEETFYPASDSTPVKHGHGRNGGPSHADPIAAVSDSSMWTDSSMQPSILQTGATTAVSPPSVGASSPFNYGSPDRSIVTTQEAGDASFVGDSSGATSPSQSGGDRKHNGAPKSEAKRSQGEMATDIYSVGAASMV
jgi:hypothetical protein